MRYLSLVLCVLVCASSAWAQGGCRSGRAYGGYRGGYGVGGGAYGGGYRGYSVPYTGGGAYGGNGGYGIPQTPGYTFNRAPNWYGGGYQYPGVNQGFSYYQQNPQFLYNHQYYQQYNPPAGIGGYGGGYYGSPYNRGQGYGTFPFYGPYNQYYSPPVYSPYGY